MKQLTYIRFLLVVNYIDTSGEISVAKMGFEDFQEAHKEFIERKKIMSNKLSVVLYGYSNTGGRAAIQSQLAKFWDQ